MNTTRDIAQDDSGVSLQLKPLTRVSDVTYEYMQLHLSCMIYFLGITLTLFHKLFYVHKQGSVYLPFTAMYIKYRYIPSPNFLIIRIQRIVYFCMDLHCMQITITVNTLSMPKHCQCRQQYTSMKFNRLMLQRRTSLYNTAECKTTEVWRQTKITRTDKIQQITPLTDLIIDLITVTTSLSNCGTDVIFGPHAMTVNSFKSLTTLCSEKKHPLTFSSISL